VAQRAELIVLLVVLAAAGWFLVPRHLSATWADIEFTGWVALSWTRSQRGSASRG
jgi:hypothetical protein